MSTACPLHPGHASKAPLCSLLGDQVCYPSRPVDKVGFTFTGTARSTSTVSLIGRGLMSGQTLPAKRRSMHNDKDTDTVHQAMDHTNFYMHTWCYRVRAYCSRCADFDTAPQGRVAWWKVHDGVGGGAAADSLGTFPAHASVTRTTSIGHPPPPLPPWKPCIRAPVVSTPSAGCAALCVQVLGGHPPVDLVRVGASLCLRATWVR